MIYAGCNHRWFSTCYITHKCGLPSGDNVVQCMLIGETTEPTAFLHGMSLSLCRHLSRTEHECSLCYRSCCNEADDLRHIAADRLSTTDEYGRQDNNSTSLSSDRQWSEGTGSVTSSRRQHVIGLDSALSKASNQYAIRPGIARHRLVAEHTSNEFINNLARHYAHCDSISHPSLSLCVLSRNYHYQTFH